MVNYSVKLGMSHLNGVGINLSPYFFATKFTQDQFIFDPTFPHNIFSEIFAETGIIGLVLFFLFIYLTLRNHFNLKTRINIFAVGSIVYLISAQIYPIFLNQPELSSFLFLYLGLAIYIGHDQKISHNYSGLFKSR